MGINAFGSMLMDCKLSRLDFSFHYAIGKGGFGKVWVVSFQNDKSLYAMKEMQKLRVLSKNCINSVLNEQKLLSFLHHPFIVNMKFAFQDKANLYLVMDLMRGGDLRYHLTTNSKFTENQVKFISACIITGLEYLHINQIIHLDLKPENLVFDLKGYLRITDFGISCHSKYAKVSKGTTGTLGYIAPEVILGQKASFSADHFALGVIIHEMITGRKPYPGRTRSEIKEWILARQAKLTKSCVPKGWSLEIVDFVNKLIQRKPQDRIGFGGINELKNHLWLRDVNWKWILEKKEEACFKPLHEINFDPRGVIEFQQDLDYSVDLQQVQEVFKGYFFDWRETKKSTMGNIK
jgi:serine/threonine protein kinase